jgi:tetratricopeptide (TPR) repeat protein
MSEITLQNYYAKLEDFLQQQRNDEVVQHSRHILRAFPRNVTAYRLLGTALLASGQYEDAERALRRVLRVYPADKVAHQGLSRIAEHRRDGPAVVWHLERAYEQDPNDPKIQEAMRDAYRQYRKTELTRLPLTARLIASQQIRSGLYPKAISTLRAAIQQLSTRIDLQVLLAQALWEAGYEIEAGEAALQILNSLPESLEANEIMTRLWLREGRPSDAQRYLSRIESVDPLYAFQVAQGTAAPDNIFRLTEFNYQLEANRQLVSDSPDWLSSFGDETADTTDDSLDDFALTDESSAPADAANDDDWLSAAFSLDDVEDDADEEVDPLAFLTADVSDHVITDNDSVPELDAPAVSETFSLQADDDDDWMSAFELPEDLETADDNLNTSDVTDAPADDRAWIDILNEVQSSAPATSTAATSTDEFAQLFTNQQDFGQPDLNQPDLNQPDLNQPDLNQPDLNSLDFDEPDFGQPDVAQADFNQPDAPLADADELAWDAAANDDLWSTIDLDSEAEETAETSISSDQPAASTPNTDDKVSTPVLGASGRTGLTGLLSSLDEPSSGSTGLTGLLDAMDDSTELTTDELAPGSKADDWMRDVNKPTARLDPETVYANDFEPIDESLSWLGSPAEEVELPDPADYDPDDSLAWMRDSGIEFMPDAPASALDEAFAADSSELQGEVSDPNIDNPLAWARGLGVEFLETDQSQSRQSMDLAETTRADDVNVTADADANADVEEDGLAWMSDAGVQWLDNTPEDEAPADNFSTSVPQGDFTFTEQDGQGAMNDENNDRTPDWLSSDNQGGDDFGAEDFEADLFGTTEPDTGDDSLDWLSMLEEDESDNAAVPNQPAETSSATSGSLAFDDEFSELDRALGLDSVPDSGTEEVLPDWLLASRPDSGPAAETPSNTPSFDESFFDVPAISSVEDELAMAWEADNNNAADDELDLEAEEFEITEEADADEEAVPDWLSALNPTGETEQNTPAPVSDFEAMINNFDPVAEDIETEDELFSFGEQSFGEQSFGSPSFDAPSFETAGTSESGAAEEEFTSNDDFGQWALEADENGVLLPFDSVEDGSPSGIGGDFDFDSDADLFNRATAASPAASPVTGETDSLTNNTYSSTGIFDNFELSGDAIGGEVSNETGDEFGIDEEEFDFAFSDSADSDEEISEQMAATGENLPDWLLEIGDSNQPANTEAVADTPAQVTDSVETEGEIPAWLQNAAPAEMTDAVTDDFELSFDEADESATGDELVGGDLWDLDEEEEEAPAVSMSDSSSWLNDFSLETEADEETPVTSSSNWLNEFSLETEADHFAPDADIIDADDIEEFDFDAASAEVTTSQALGDFGDFGEVEEEATATGEFNAMPSWMAALDEAEEEEQQEENAITAPSPISSLDLATEDTGFEDEFGIASGDDLVLDVDELEAQLPSTVETFAADGETLDRELDWMLEDEEEEPEFVAQFGELPRLEEADQNEEEVFELDAGGFGSNADFEIDGEEEALHGLELDEEIEAVPASNAPDWLNAMVPGLDLDYEAEASDDEFSDEIFAAEEEAAAAASSTGSYAWVNDIVQEELRPPMTMPEPVRATTESATVAAPEERRPRFSFDRAPLWLRRMRGEKPNVLGGSTNGDDDSDAAPYNATTNAAGAIGAGVMLNEAGLADTDVAAFDADLFDDEVFDGDAADDDAIFDLNDVDVDNVSMDEFDTLDDLDDFDDLDDLDDFDSLSGGASATSYNADFGSDFETDDDLDLDDGEDTDLPPWLRVDGDD